MTEVAGSQGTVIDQGLLEADSKTRSDNVQCRTEVFARSGIIVLAGLAMSISYGLGEDGMRSMQYELRGLTIGGGLFILGWLLEGAVGGR